MSFKTHNLSLLPSVFMTYCFSCSCSCFSSFSYFIYLYRNTDVFTHHSCILIPQSIYFYLEIGIIPIGSSKPKLWHFHAKLVNLSILPEGQFAILIFQFHDSIFYTGSLYSYKYKVLRFLLQLESPKSEHRNSSYVRNNPDYSMIKTEEEFCWIIALL